MGGAGTSVVAAASAAVKIIKSETKGMRRR